MRLISRKNFVRKTMMATAAFLVRPSWASSAVQPLLSFSTLGCPDWTLEQIINFARQHGYQGIEVRGLQRQLDLPLSPAFSTADNRQRTMALMKEKGLRFVGLGSSANLHLPNGAEREKSLSGAKAFVDLAQQIACPYVRVFPNNFPKEQTKAETINLIATGLQELGDYAKGKNVMVLMETHGDVVYVDDIAAILKAASHPSVGLVWDVANMWTVTKEPPAVAYRRLGHYIRHTHIKDAKLVDGKPVYTLLGEGEVPIFEAIHALKNGGYKGYYSFEWEKLWHPEIAEPEVALAHFPRAMKKQF